MNKRMPRKAITRRQALGVITAGTASATAAFSEGFVGMDDGLSRPVSMRPPEVRFDVVEEEWIERLVRELAEKQGVLKLLQSSGIPSYKKQELRRRTANKIHAIHPDVAALRSLSLTHKFRMQAAINYRNAMRGLGADLKTEIDDLIYQIEHRIAYHIW